LAIADFGLSNPGKANRQSALANRQSEGPSATADGTDLTPQNGLNQSIRTERKNPMKKTSSKLTLALSAVVLATLFASSLIFVSSNARAQQQAPPANKMVEFHMALLKHGPSYNAAGMSQDLKAQHIASVMSLLESGKAVIAGPIGDDGDIAGVLIFRAASAAEARSWAENDPAVKAGFFAAEMHPWWSEDVMKKPTMPLKLTTAYLALLTRGGKWTPEKTPATEQLQKDHIANIVRLAELKKLVVAGPFGDNGTLRGIFVFKVGSLEEARALSETDPAVKAGRLAIDVRPWMVPEGILP